MFIGPRNPKCVVYAGRIFTNKGQGGASQYYDKFKMQYPVSFDTSGTALKSTYGMPIGLSGKCSYQNRVGDSS